MLGNALRADLPHALKRQLAMLIDGPPNDPVEWTYEIKLDGYRILTRFHRLTHIAKAIGAMGFKSGWFDGKVVVPDEKGIPDFQALQNAF